MEKDDKGGFFAHMILFLFGEPWGVTAEWWATPRDTYKYGTAKEIEDFFPDLQLFPPSLGLLETQGSEPAVGHDQK